MDRLNTKLVLTCVLGAVVIAVMLWSVGPERLTELVSGALPGHLAAAALAIVFLNVIATIRWQLLMSSLGYELSFADSFFQISGAFLLSTLTPGRAGEVFRLYLSKRISHIDASHSGAALLIERACDLSVMSSLILLGLVTGMGAQLGAFGDAARITVGFTLLLVAVLVLSVRHRAVMGLVVRVLSFGGRRGVPGCARGAEKIEESIPAFLSVARRVSVPTVFGITVLIWAAQVARMWFICIAVGADISPMVVGLTYCLGLLLGVVSYIPGGLVVTEGTMVGLLVVHGVQTDIATVGVVIDRLCAYWAAVVMGVMSLSYKADVLLFDISSGEMPDMADEETATCPTDDEGEKE